MHSSSQPAERLISHQPLSHDAIEDYDEAIVVFGSRSFTDFEQFTRALEEYICIEHAKAHIIFITGAAKSGPDDMIIRWCRKNGYAWTEYPADWDDISVEGSFVKKNSRGKLYNARAGHMRNRAMAEVMTQAVGFWDGFSPGTRNMIDEAERVGITPKVFLVNGERKDTRYDEVRSAPGSRSVHSEVH